MKRKSIIPINIINLAVIVTIMATVGFLTQNTIKELTLNDIQTVTKLTQKNIYTEIVQEFLEPINTSIIMAQNTFLLDLLDKDNQETEKSVAEYLTAIQNETGYESVFWVPHSTLKYYHPGGTDDKVNLSSDDSFWYKKTMSTEDSYSIVVNTEQLDDWALTVYVDAAIKDREGNFAGVTGVGKRLTHLLDILSRYEESQDVEVYLINDIGEIQIHEDISLVTSGNFFDLEGVSPEDFNIKDSTTGPIEKQIGGKFITIHHIPMMDWHLVVTKSTSKLTHSLNRYSMRIYISLSIAVLTMYFATRYTISRYRKQIIKLSNIDQLTGIPNRTIFETTFQEAVENMSKQIFCLALFDFDNLKTINDKLGHDMGDKALCTIALLARDFFKSPDVVSRVGGDEFAVIIHKPLSEALILLETFHKAVQNETDLINLETTISIGVTESKTMDQKSDIYKRADLALYESKETGRNKLSVNIQE